MTRRVRILKITEEILRQFLSLVTERDKIKVHPAYEQGFKDGARKFKEYIDHLQKDEEECESSL